MNEKRLVSICQYQLYRERQMTMILLLILGINFALGAILKMLGTTGGSIEMVTLIFASIMGYALFSDTFKFSTYNGAARKTYMIATCVTAILLSVTWSLLTSVIVLLAERFTTVNLLFANIYPNGFFAMFLWLFASILCLTMFSWVVAVIMYSISKKAKLLLLLGISLLVAALILINVLMNGEVIDALVTFAYLLLGIVDNTISPYLSAAMFVLLSLGSGIIGWSFVRKAEI